MPTSTGSSLPLPKYLNVSISKDIFSVSVFVSEEKSNVLDWLDLIPWDAVSTSDVGSVPSTPGPSSPFASPSRDENSADSVTQLLEQSAEEFLPVFDAAPASPALSVIDDEDTLFAALRLNPQQVLAESEARLAASRASSVGHASDMESEAEDEAEAKVAGKDRPSFVDLFGDGDTDEEDVGERHRQIDLDLFGDGDRDDETTQDAQSITPSAEQAPTGVSHDLITAGIQGTPCRNYELWIPNQSIFFVRLLSLKISNPISISSRTVHVLLELKAYK